MTKIIQNEIYANIHLKKCENDRKNYTNADVAYMSALIKINDIRSKKQQERRIVR